MPRLPKSLVCTVASDYTLQKNNLVLELRCLDNQSTTCVVTAGLKKKVNEFVAKFRRRLCWMERSLTFWNLETFFQGLVLPKFKQFSFFCWPASIGNFKLFFQGIVIWQGCIHPYLLTVFLYQHVIFFRHLCSSCLCLQSLCLYTYIDIVIPLTQLQRTV